MLSSAMFEEGQLYSPSRSRLGAVRASRSRPPGLQDAAYRERRNEIAASALAWRPGTVPAPVPYTDAENEVWRLVSAELAVKHERYAVREFLDAKTVVALPEDRVPQLFEVTERLAPLTGWAYHPAPGLVGLREFYGSLAERVFHSTQYVRHPLQAALHAGARHHPRGHRARVLYEDGERCARTRAGIAAARYRVAARPPNGARSSGSARGHPSAN